MMVNSLSEFDMHKWETPERVFKYTDPKINMQIISHKVFQTYRVFDW